MRRAGNEDNQQLPMLRLLLDVTALMRLQRTGVAVYVRELAAAMARRNDVELRPVWRPSRWRRRRLIAHHLSIPPRPFLPIVGRLAGDIYHGPDFRIPSRGLLPRIVTIHDLVVFEENLVDARFALEGRERTTKTIRRNRPDGILVVSSFTRDRLCEHFPEVEQIVRVTYPGIDHRLFTVGSRSVGGPPFLLAAGSIEKRKNLERTIRAFERVHSLRPDLRLIVAGGDGHDAVRIRARARESSACRAITFVGYVDDRDLVELYRSAEMLLYPSLYEGFGLPVVEAMACGCPVLTSNRGAMAEVGGVAAVTVDPEDTDEIAQGIMSILDQDGLRADLIRRGIERSASYTWDRCADDTMAAYRETGGR